MKSVVVAVTLLLPVVTNAQNWTRAFDGREFSIDVDAASIRLGYPVEAWSLWNWSSSQSIEGTGLIWKTKFRSQKRLYWYHCADGASTLRQLIYYSKRDGAGDVVSSASWEQLAESYSSASPGSAGRSVLDFVCRK